MHGAGRDAEVGEKPEGSGGEGGRDSGDEGVEFGLGEAVEEEMGDDEVVFLWGGRGEGEGVCLISVEACGCGGGCCFAALTEELKHGGTGVYGVGLEGGVLGEESGEEAAVAVSKGEGVLLAGEGGEGVEAGAFEGVAEG